MGEEAKWTPVPLINNINKIIGRNYREFRYFDFGGSPMAVFIETDRDMVRQRGREIRDKRDNGTEGQVQVAELFQIPTVCESKQRYTVASLIAYDSRNFQNLGSHKFSSQKRKRNSC